MSVVRQYTVDVGFTPAELAAIFCAMCSDEQAAFFSTIKTISADWPIGFDLQALSIVNDADNDALIILRSLAGHTWNRDHRKEA